jgi:MFS family permease
MLRSPLQLPNFRRLWLGQTLIFGAAEYWFIALTWLVLQKTGSGLAVSTVLIAAAIPRGLFMLVGGAISDRLPSNNVASFAAWINTVLIGLVTALLMFDAVELKYLIVSAVLFGLSEAVLYPAILALLPQLINKSQLGEANAWIQGSEQMTDVIVPAAVGLIIGAVGLRSAFAINTVVFAFGSLFIYQIRTLPKSLPAKPKADSLKQIQAIKDEIVVGLRYAWTEPAIRISLLLLAMINFAMLGPIIIGVAALVKVRFDDSATTFGYLQSAYGIGSLLGLFLASQWREIKSPKTALILLCYGLGAGLIALGFVQNVSVTWGVIAMMGIGCGLVTVLGITWLQQNTNVQMQGRIMSLAMFAGAALEPFSQAITGALLEVSLTGLFITAGVTMLLTALVSSMTFRFKTNAK